MTTTFIPIHAKIEDHYVIEKILGKGLHATAFVASSKDKNERFAIKTMNDIRGSRMKKMAYEALLKEASILSEINHEKIVKFYGAYEYESKMSIVLELLEGGELFNYISQLNCLTEDDSKNFSRQVAEALCYLHSIGIAHLDLKPENIVLKSTETKEIKLVDFSISHKIVPGHSLKIVQGTLEFTAPEILNFDTVGFPADMWAFGVLVYFFLTGVSPFYGEEEEETRRNIMMGSLDFEYEEFENCDASAMELIQKLLVRNPNERLTAKESLAHFWLNLKEKPKSVKRLSTIQTKGFKDFVRRNKWQDSVRKLAPATQILKNMVGSNSDNSLSQAVDRLSLFGSIPNKTSTSSIISDSNTSLCSIKTPVFDQVDCTTDSDSPSEKNKSL